MTTLEFNSLGLTIYDTIEISFTSREALTTKLVTEDVLPEEIVHFQNHQNVLPERIMVFGEKTPTEAIPLAEITSIRKID